MRPRSRLQPPVALTFVLCLLASGLTAVRATAQTADQLVVNNGPRLSLVPLPYGADEAEVLELSQNVLEVAYFDDGTAMAIRTDGEGNYLLARIESDSTVVDVGVIEPAEDAFLGEGPLDLAVDSGGRLFALFSVGIWWNPPDGYHRLIELDPDDASTLSNLRLDRFPSWIARAPSGFWTSEVGVLQHLDPDTGVVTAHSVAGQPVAASGHDGDTDSTGALWLVDEGVCSPPCYFYRRLDPATGAQKPFDTPRLNPQFFTVTDLAVRRSCAPTDTAPCVQGGRFRAEVSWRDFEGNVGAGRSTPARSADSSIFWFFDAANWELMVKVLDGCELGGHFWVFASGSTNVEFSLTVTDLLTGDVRRYDNPLGHTAVTVTDTMAFACEP